MTVLQQLKAEGLQIFLAGENLKCGPKHLLTDENRTLILEHKAAIMQELKREGPPYPDGLGRVKCFYCTRLVDGVCKSTKARMDGLSLLRECQNFSMNTIH